MTAQEKCDKLVPYVGKQVYVIMAGEDGNVHPHQVTLKWAEVRGGSLALVEFYEYPNYVVSADLVGMLNESQQFVSLSN